MKKILLIGKTGQLGAEIIKDAFSFGFEVFGFEKEELDVTKELQVREKIKEIKPDILINTSAYNAVSMCEKDPMPAMMLNFIAVQNLASICKENNIIFVTYSTDYVFDGKKGSPYDENDKPNPLQLYGISKASGEHATLNYYSKGSFLIRTCGLFAGRKGSQEKGGNFVLNIMKEAQNKEIIEVSSEQIVSPTYAKDLSEATLKLLKSKAEPGIYHLVNEGYCSWYEFTKEIFKLAGIDKKLLPVSRESENSQVKRPKFSALRNTKAKALGIELPSWQEGVKSYLNFLNL
jgi:dTDP-4-dehydrorhamnose reductase